MQPITRLLTSDEIKAQEAAFGSDGKIVEMEPKIEDSVVQTGPGQWAMGTQMLCERLTGPAPPDAVTTWEDDNSTYCLRPNPTPTTTKISAAGDSAAGRIYIGGFERAVWSIGSDTICKVSSWKERMGSEAATMRFVTEKVPAMPIPKVYYDWTDPAWERSFIIMSRIRGKSLEDSWEHLSPRQRRRLASQVQYWAWRLKGFKSDRFETADRECVPFFGLSKFEQDPSQPAYIPLTAPPRTGAELSAELRERSGLEPPSFEEGFSFAHLDLSTQNVFVVDPIPPDQNFFSYVLDGMPSLLAGIIDWGLAGYVPLWYTYEIIRDGPTFELNWDKGNIYGWRDLLLQKLSMTRCVYHLPWYAEFQTAELAKKGFVLKNGMPVPIEKTESENQS